MRVFLIVRNYYDAGWSATVVPLGSTTPEFELSASEYAGRHTIM